jgi:hypothetical protein
MRGKDFCFSVWTASEFVHGRSVKGRRATRRPCVRGQAPLVREPLSVLIQQLLGIDPVAHERPATEVVDEQIMGLDHSNSPCFSHLAKLHPLDFVDPWKSLLNGYRHVVSLC